MKAEIVLAYSDKGVEYQSVKYDGETKFFSDRQEAIDYALTLSMDVTLRVQGD